MGLWKSTFYGNLVCSIFQCISDQYVRIYTQRRLNQEESLRGGEKTKAEREQILVKKNTNYIYGGKRCVGEGGISGFRGTQVEEQWRSDLGRSTS